MFVSMMDRPLEQPTAIENAFTNAEVASDCEESTTSYYGTKHQLAARLVTIRTTIRPKLPNRVKEGEYTGHLMNLFK